MIGTSRRPILRALPEDGNRQSLAHLVVNNLNRRTAWRFPLGTSRQGALSKHREGPKPIKREKPPRGVPRRHAVPGCPYKRGRPALGRGRPDRAPGRPSRPGPGKHITIRGNSRRIKARVGLRRKDDGRRKVERAAVDRGPTRHARRGYRGTSQRNPRPPGNSRRGRAYDSTCDRLPPRLFRLQHVRRRNAGPQGPF